MKLSSLRILTAVATFCMLFSSMSFAQARNPSLLATCVVDGLTTVTSVPNGTKSVTFVFKNVKNSTVGPYSDGATPFVWVTPIGSTYANPGATRSVTISTLDGSGQVKSTKNFSCA